MKSPDPLPQCDQDQDNQSPGVPGFRTWRGVYGLVIAWFILVVVLLALFTRAFS